MEREKVLIAAPVHSVLLQGLSDAGYQLIMQERIDQAGGMEHIKHCVGVITSTRLQIDRAMIDQAPALRFIGRMGSGMEVIDVPYATSKGIRCVSSPEGNSNAVAEHTLGLLLSLTKKITKSHIEVTSGSWIRDANRGTELEGKSIGIIGYGNTGAAFARLLSVFGVRIFVYDKYKEISPEPHIHVCHSMQELQQMSQIVSVHVPHQQDTYHMIDRQFIREMQHQFILLNSARGTVVRTIDVIEGLKSGKIIAFGADVWEEEPLEKMSPESRLLLQEALQMQNCVITPHIAGYSHEALYKMSLLLLERITQ